MREGTLKTILLGEGMGNSATGKLTSLVDRSVTHFAQNRQTLHHKCDSIAPFEIKITCQSAIFAKIT
jgi:hypothetical protein